MRQYPHLSGSGIGEFCFPVLISCQRIDAGAEQQATVLIGGKRNHSMLHPAVFSAGIFYPQVVAEHIITIVLGGRVAGDVAKEGNLLCMAPAEIIGIATVEDEILVKRRKLADPFLRRNAQHVGHSAEVAVTAVSAVVSHRDHCILCQGVCPGYHLTFCKHLFFIAFRIKRLREIQLLYWFEILVHIFFMRYSLDACAPIIQEDKPCSIPILAQYICKNTKNIQKCEYMD